MEAKINTAFVDILFKNDKKGTFPAFMLTNFQFIQAQLECKDTKIVDLKSVELETFMDMISRIHVAQFSNLYTNGKFDDILEYLGTKTVLKKDIININNKIIKIVQFIISNGCTYDEKKTLGVIPDKKIIYENNTEFKYKNVIILTAAKIWKFDIKFGFLNSNDFIMKEIRNDIRKLAKFIRYQSNKEVYTFNEVDIYKCTTFNGKNIRCVIRVEHKYSTLDLSFHYSSVFITCI
jgi:hypothetical protein